MKEIEADRAARGAAMRGNRLRSPRLVRAAIETLEDRRLLAAFSLDPSFGGGDGAVAVDYPSTGTTSYGYGGAIADDGSIYIAGAGRANTGSVGPAGLAALTPSGELDPAFSGDGLISLTVDPAFDSQFHAVDVAPGGKVVAVGYDKFVLGDILVARFNTDGTPDTTFGPDGYRTYGFGDPDKAYAVEVLDDGKILVGGTVSVIRNDMTVLRYNVDGTVDTTFGSNGRVGVDFYGGNDDVYDMAVADDGDIVAVGRAFLSGRGNGPTIARFNSDGTFDTAFAGGGAIDLYNTLGWGEFDSVELLADGKILAAGYVNGSPLVARFNANGSLDTTFGGGDGSVSTADVTLGFRNAYTEDIAVRADGSILLSLTDDVVGSTQPVRPALALFTPDGVLDATFGTNGLVVIDEVPGAPHSAYANDLLIDDAGRPLLVGSSAGDVLALRLTADPPPPSDPVVLDAHGTLSITGTDGNDVVDVANNFGGSLVVTFNGTAYPFPFASVSKIEADLGEGDDFLSTRQAIFKPVNYTGGVGNDALFSEASNGSEESASITGTTFFAGGNNVRFSEVEAFTADLMYGDDTATVRIGGSSTNVTVLAGGGDDTITMVSSGPGTATLVGEEGNDFFINTIGDIATLIAGPGQDGVFIGGTAGDDLGVLRYTSDGAQVGLLSSATGPLRRGFRFEGAPDIESANFDLGAGNDDLSVLYDAIYTDRTLAVSMLGGDGIDDLAWQAARASNVPVTVTLTDGLIGTGLFSGTFDAATELVSLSGTDLADRFEVTPIAQEVVVHGQNPNPDFGHTGQDVLALDLTNATGLEIGTGVGGGTFAFDNAGTITWFDIEAFEGLPTARPSLVSSGFDYETDQVVELVLADTDPASVNLSDAVLTNLDTGQAVANPFALLNGSGGPNIDTVVSFHRVVDTFGVLPNGNYRFTLPVGSIESTDGLANDTAITHDFFVLAGDTNRDRTVSLADFLTLRSNFGQSGKVFSEGDFSYDGQVSLADFLILRSNFGTNLPPPSSASPLPRLFVKGGGGDEKGGGLVRRVL